MGLDRNLELVGSDTEHTGFYTVGAVLPGGGFVTLAAIKLGTVEQTQNVPTALAVTAANEADAQQAEPTDPATEPVEPAPADSTTSTQPATAATTTTG